MCRPCKHATLLYNVATNIFFLTQTDKLIRKFRDDPHSLEYPDVKKILLLFGFELIPAKGSHVKFKHGKEGDLIIPVHNNRCKDFYKKQAKDRIEKIIKNAK